MNKLSTIFLPLFAFLCGSCNKFLDINAPASSVETQKIFENENTALSAVKGLYGQVRTSATGIMNGGLSFYPGVGSDELYNPTNLSTLQSFYTNGLLSDNSTVLTMWTNGYQYIYSANAVLDALSKSTGIGAGNKNMYRGEMLYMRALVYFYLINLYGDVPLILSPDYIGNATLGRSPVNKIYEQIIADLLEAQALLAASYGTLPNTRVNTMAATALLARVYLYRGQWGNAETQASTVINSNSFRLEPDLNKVFLNTSPEVIFQVSRVNTNSSEGGAFIPASVTTLPVYAATDYLLNIFSADDERKTNWFRTNIVSGRQYYYPYKYKVRSSTTSTEYEVVQRLAEVYLIRAEAYAQQGKTTDAQNDLNKIRNRAGLANTIATTQPELIAAITLERQIELFAEWGHRWFDLKRTGKVDEVLGVRKAPNWQATDSIYPIPISQVNANPALKQNPGYE